MYRNRKKYIKPASWILFLLCFYAAASFTGCDPALFCFKELPSFRSGGRHAATGSLLFSEDPCCRFFYTVQMSVTGTVTGSALALIVSPFWRRVPAFSVMGKAFSASPDPGTPVFSGADPGLAATFLFGLGTFAGTFAITLYTFAIMTKLTYEDAEHADTAPYQALRSMGCARFPAFIHAVLPEILPAFLTNALYLFETNVRHSSILGYVGAGGIGLILNEKISWREFHKVGTILLLLFLTVCVIESANRYFTSMIHSGQITELFRQQGPV